MPAGISIAAGNFHEQSAFHKSRKGFISLRSVLKDTALKPLSLYRKGKRLYALFLLYRSFLGNFYFLNCLKIYDGVDNDSDARTYCIAGEEERERHLNGHTV